MDSDIFRAFCQEASYIAAFDILNIPRLADPDSSRELSSNLSKLAISNITTYMANPASILLNNFKYEVITSLPLAKPLAIQCPIPACVFPISGYFTFLQRVLLYLNIIIASFALRVPLLRGVAQIWLTTFWFSVVPAVLIVHVGILPTLLWFSFRAEPGEPRHAAIQGERATYANVPEERQGVEAPKRLGTVAICKLWFQTLKKTLSEFPVTRFLVPAYALFGLANIIIANTSQNSGGFWPEETAVILSNGTDYLLTSPCYADQSGFVGLWLPAPSPYNGIRNLSSLAIYYPPLGSSAVGALQATSKVALTSMHVGSVLLCFAIFILSFFKLGDLEDQLRESFRSSAQNKRIIRYIIILPFLFPLLLAVILTLYVIIKFELNAWNAALPESEAYTEIGPWGPYVVGIVVFTATLTARIRGWNFDTKDTDSGNRSFGWLLPGKQSNDESEEGQSDQAPLIPLEVLPMPGEPMSLSV
ncbi:hypothetical protein N431DRAFT_512418 [Stipitochalara longipes BDJ]|nr:hypothetical protein N431DRAFT_512418 [Stipitochalara longipes BDJ]